MNKSREPGLDPDIVISESASWTWPEATPGQRAAAYVLDILIIIAAFELLSVLCSRFAGVSVPAVLQGVFAVIYAVIFHAKTGQTLGKKMLGIRVVSIRPELADSPLSIRQLLLREIFGRLISVMLLLYGYLRIVLNADRRGLHDLIGDTRVISLSQSESRPIQFRYIFAGALGVALVCAAGYAYTIMYTTYPLKEYARSLELKGYKFDGMHGSLVKGFTVEHIFYSSDDCDFEVFNTEIKYDWRNSDEESEFLISRFVFERANLNIKKINALPFKSKAPDGKKDGDGPFGLQADLKNQAKEKLRVFTLKSGELNNLELTMPGQQTYRIDRILVSDLQAKPDELSLMINQLNVESRLFNVDVGDVSFQRNKLSLLKAAAIQIQPALFPELLKAPVDVKIQGEFEDFKPTSAKASAFSNRIQVSVQGDLTEVTVSQFSPFHYFKTDLPIWDLNFKISGDFKNRKLSQLTGSAGLRHVRFDLGTLNMLHLRNGKTYTMAPRLAADWKAMLAGRDPGIILGSSDHRMSKDVLTELIYSRDFAKLSPSEKDIIERDSRFFADTIDAGVKPPPLPIPVARANPSSSRRPSSAKNRQSAGRGVPLKLPAYKKKSR